MHWWIAVCLAAAPGWGEYPRPTQAQVNPEPPVGSPERNAELDAMQAALGEWARERKEASRERERLRELKAEREALRASEETGAPAEVVRGPATREGRHIEPKVIDVAPEPTREQAEGWLEQEAAKHKASPEQKEEDAKTEAAGRAMQQQLDAERKEK